ncbi:MAG: FAD-binding protein, partial [Armatimonadota bacterium]
MPTLSKHKLNEKLNIKCYTCQTLIIGSGAAALNCAEHLHDLGVADVVIATDRLGAGTSNNSGSDKQTYYKLAVFGDVPDSPMELAHALYDGGMMHGDIAYVESLCSAQEFFHLVKNGVPFPHNRYGAYVGYKTDHDPRQRATSAGPRTSMYMFEKSLANVRRNGTPIFDRHEVIALLTAGGASDRRVVGALAINTDEVAAPDYGLTLFNAENVVMATGGPGEMYAVSVYPPGQIGNHGIALEIGAIANNLAESQFGLASTGFRWNLSGTYQQVIPCYFSTDAEGRDRRYFLNEYFYDMKTEATDVFLKGYQWPFHAARLQNLGSSVVDIAVHNERSQGRRVFMDFTRNPVADQGLDEFSLDRLGDEAIRYLHRSGALQATPYERLQHMNPEAIELYGDHGVSLREPLEIAVCAQHCNGGLRANIWWESNVKHLFLIGEVCGTHGVRPGGSALNAGQVGGLRAAQCIASVYAGSPMSPATFFEVVRARVGAELANLERIANPASDAIPFQQVRREIQERMSREAAFIRSADSIGDAVNEALSLQAAVERQGLSVTSRAE